MRLLPGLSWWLAFTGMRQAALLHARRGSETSRGGEKIRGKVFALTHNYTGYPMVKEAREWVRSGKLGKLMKVVVEYPQGYAITARWNLRRVARFTNWRMDPKNVSGVSNCMGDIGTHAHNLARYITGLETEEICAELSTFIPGRLLDDDGNCLVRFSDGVKEISLRLADFERRGK